MNLEIIKANFVYLSLNLELENFITALLLKGLLTLYDYDSLQAKSKVQRNQEFLLNLIMYGDECEQEFYRYLNLLGIQLSSSSGVFTTNNVKLDRKSYFKVHALLSERINATAIASKLYEQGYWSSAKLEKVLTAPTRSQKARELVDNLNLSLGAPGFGSCFLSALNEFQPDLFKRVVAKLS